MRQTTFKTVSLIVFLFTVLNLNAVPALPYPIKVTQPDGSELTIYLRGDEYFHYKTTLDGYALKENAKGVLTYAITDNNHNLISTDVKASEIKNRSLKERQFLGRLKKNIDFSKINRQNRSMKARSSFTESASSNTYPLSGTPKSIVILVNFTDTSFVTTNPQVAFTNLLNKNGYSTNGGTGSAKDYFRDNSMGSFDPEFDVVGPYNLPHKMSYYGANDANGDDVNPRQMVIDACSLASAAGIDFSQYDTDNDGLVDNVFIYYAGYNEAEGGPKNSVWPHRWVLANKNTRFNGVSIYDYACTSELRGRSGSTMCGIGTFCHEFGHVLGLDDMYNTDGDYTYNTLSYWDIMDAGPYLNSGRTPPSYSGYERFFLNWAKPVELKTPGDITLDTLSTSNQVNLISQYGNHNLVGSNPNPVEFFLLENRQKSGWDTYLPGHGMLITHIYYNPTTWDNNTPNNDPQAMGVDIVEADGLASDNNLSGDPFPGTSYITSYNPVLRDGTNIEKPLSKIQEINGIISFKFGSNIQLSNSLKEFQTVQGTPSEPQNISLSAKNLTADLTISFSTGQHFEMKKLTDQDTAWSKTITIVPIDSVIDSTIIQIRYNPTVPSYSVNQDETIIFKSGTTDYKELAISGKSTRPVYVVPPVATEATDITSYSFIANWEPVFDASGYYLTVYNISNGTPIDLTEGFDNGLTPSPNWIITAKSTTSSTLYSGTKIPAIQFLNKGEYVETEEYLLPVTKLSFYMRSMGASSGGFLVEALDANNNWNKIDSISLTSTLKEIKSYTFLESKDYIRFRFTFYKGIGNLTFDDVTVSFAKRLEYNEKDTWITDTTDTLYNLIPNTEYVYKVRASDKTVNYENITDFSNIITLTTLVDKSSTLLRTKVESSGDVTVYLPTMDNSLYIYNLIGQCIKIIVPNSNTLSITDLPRNQFYIFKAGNREAKIAI